VETFLSLSHFSLSVTIHASKITIPFLFLKHHGSIFWPRESWGESRKTFLPQLSRGQKSKFAMEALVTLATAGTIGLLQKTITWYMVVGKLIIIPALGH